jgi:hypothetical protein
MRGSRNRLSEAVISALLRDFSKHGEKAIAKVRRTQPAAYLKCLVLLVPREHKVEHSNPLKAMSDEELDEALDALRDLLARREAAANVIEGSAEPVALPAPEAQSPEATPKPTQKRVAFSPPYILSTAALKGLRRISSQGEGHERLVA